MDDHREVSANEVLEEFNRATREYVVAITSAVLECKPGKLGTDNAALSCAYYYHTARLHLGIRLGARAPGLHEMSLELASQIESETIRLANPIVRNAKEAN